MIKKVFFSLIISLSLFSCNEVSDFLFDTDKLIEMRSISNGSIYQSGASVPITLDYKNPILPDQFTVTIFDDVGISWGETKIQIPNHVQKQFSTSLIIPEILPKGKYIFHLRVYEKEKEILFKEIVLFKVDEAILINELYSMPHETEVGKDVVIKALISSAEDTDPFLRWSLNNEIIGEGLFSEGFDSINWKASNDNGLYTIYLEVFPEPCDITFKSSVNSKIEIIVSDDSDRENNNLPYEDKYSLLYHFSGNLNPFNSENYNTKSFGSFIPEYRDNLLGYTFSKDRGLNAQGMILPTSKGKITPFSINGRVQVSNDFTPGNFIALQVFDNTIFNLSIDENGYLLFIAGDQTSKSLFDIQELTDFTLSVIPLNTGIKILWYYNGKNGGSDFLNYSFDPIFTDQNALIGSSEDIIGAEFFIDDFGFYVGNEEKSSIDGDHFVRYNLNVLADKLIVANGFDNLASGNPLLENAQNSARNGNLILEPGQSYLFDSVQKSINNIEFQLSLSIEKDNSDSKDIWHVYLKDEDDKILLILDQQDFTLVRDRETRLLSNLLQFSLVTNDLLDSVTVKTNNNRLIKLIKINYGQSLFLSIESDRKNKKDLLIDNLLIYSKVRVPRSDHLSMIKK